MSCMLSLLNEELHDDLEEMLALLDKGINPLCKGALYTVYHKGKKTHVGRGNSPYTNEGKGDMLLLLMGFCVSPNFMIFAPGK
eukprot:1158790-Pelagomonas_calceolata.AAC.14